MTHPDYLTSTSKHIPRLLSPVDGINSYSVKVQGQPKSRLGKQLQGVSIKN